MAYKISIDKVKKSVEIKKKIESTTFSKVNVVTESSLESSSEENFENESSV